MTGEWQSATLGDLVEIKHGFAFDGRYFRDTPPGDFLVTPGNFNIGGGFNRSNVRYYCGPEVAGFLLEPGDLIVTMTDLSKAGDTLGYGALVPADGRRYLHNQRIGRVTIKSGARIRLRYAHWLMRTPDYRAKVLGSATGSTVRHTSPSRISAFAFHLPPLKEQELISGLLDFLDDKIELNRRIAETLEAMAQALFKSWFVDFDPVSAKAQGYATGISEEIAALFPDHFGDDGLPEGWAMSNLAAEFHLTMGQSPPGVSYNESGSGVPLYQGRSDFGFRFPTRRVFTTAPGRMATAGDTLVSVRAPVGDLNMAYEACCLGRGVAAVRHKSASSSYTYYCLRSIQPSIAAFENEGTVFGAINKDAFSRLVVMRPEPSVIRAFDEFGSVLDGRIRNVLDENATLTSLRDTLLPRLISGELRIGEAEQTVSAA